LKKLYIVGSALIIFCWLFVIWIYSGDSETYHIDYVDHSKNAAQYEKTKISFVGDIMVHKGQLEAAKKGEIYSFSKTYKYIEDIMKSPDYFIGNLETTLNSYGNYTGYPRFRTPEVLAKDLKEKGLDILVTANNHSMDNNIEGVYETIDILDKYDIRHTGTFKKETSYLKFEKNGIRFGMSNYTYGTNGIPIPKGKENAVNLIEEKRILKELKSMKAVDVKIVYLHFGDEYQIKPNDYQRELVDKLFEGGADVIIGSHPHVNQPMEIKEVNGKQKFVIYSLGNFVSSQRGEYKDRSIILNLEFIKKENRVSIDRVSYIPIWNRYRKVGEKNIITIIPIDLAFAISEISFSDKDNALMEKAKKDLLEMYPYVETYINGEILEYIVYEEIH
jgi:poly-gamma-glutamate synthesis protein (capsule biosynthesis protein)